LKPPIPLPNNHETRVFQLGGELLSTLEKCRLPRNDETVKGIGWFLVCVGESLEKGSLILARRLRSQCNSAQQMPQNSSLAVAFCLVGDDIMNWGTALFHQEKK